MAYTFGEFTFDGPYASVDDLSIEGGVYIVTSTDGKPIDCGEGKNIQERVATHGRKDCWGEHAREADLLFYQLVVDSQENSFRRIHVEKTVRGEVKFLCGKD